MTSHSTSLGFETVLPKYVHQLYGILGKVDKLSGYDDINFQLTSNDGQKYVVKMSEKRDSVQTVESQNRLLCYIQDHHSDRSAFPRVVPGRDGGVWYEISHESQPYILRVLTYLDGTLWHQVPLEPALYKDLGRFLGVLSTCLSSFDLPEFRLISSRWDLQYAGLAMDYLADIADAHYRRLVWYFLQQYESNITPNTALMPTGLIHGDANDHNILVSGSKVTGLFDFGDATYSYLINEVAIAVTYVMMKSEVPMEAAELLVLGYHQQRALKAVELEAIYYLVAARLCISLCNSSHSQNKEPDNEYLGLHQEPVKQLLDKLITINPGHFSQRLKKTCSISPRDGLTITKLESDRSRLFSRAMSLSYEEPIVMVRGALQYLYDSKGNTFLDAVNNISHVGHCHPAIVSAASKQMTELNTNTRYLYPQLNEYAQMVCDLLPEPLSVVFFVNSGTEANDLALRLARIHTGFIDTVVIEHAYHGNSTATLEISPYKYQGKGGLGRRVYIHEVLVPDIYRGKYRAEEADHMAKYLHQQQIMLELIQKKSGGLAAFIGESILGCGGQVVLPTGYLKATYDMIRKSGGVCIADEVQVGFGRVGSHFWGFQTQDVVPDIVTMGKPMGNGHPLAAVVTTRKIAQSFENGMEYFNSFGGNPVSCEIGKAVLNTIKDEGLQENALSVGGHLKSGLTNLKEKHEAIGDVRGHGLFLGVELVLDRVTKQPAPKLTYHLVENMKKRGVLLSVDGPLRNVIKIKPPLVFSMSNANYLLEQLDQAFFEEGPAE